MRTEIDKYKENQIYLRQDGKFIWITDVDPISKIKESERDRYCFYFVGRLKAKSDEFNDDLFVVNNAIAKISISFDIKNRERALLKDIREMEVSYVGTMVDEKVAQYAKRFN